MHGEGGMSEIKKWEKYLEEYSSIIIFDDRNEDISKYKLVFLENKLEACVQKQILIMGLKDDVSASKKEYQVITEQEYNLILRLYRMYEFTDKLRVIALSPQFGSMFNYLSTGIITQEEYFEALLH